MDVLDRCSSFFRRLLEQNEIEPTRLMGIGGGASYISVDTSLAFTIDSGHSVTVRGLFAVFTEMESADLSILGRDVTNNFSVICDYPNRAVSLLAPPHAYEIKSSST